MIHKLKIWTSFADRVLDGTKTFEVRRNDRGFQKGDTIVFEVMDNDGMRLNSSHELNGKEYTITCVLSGFGLEDGYVAFGIKGVERMTEYHCSTPPKSKACASNNRECDEFDDALCYDMSCNRCSFCEDDICLLASRLEEIGYTKAHAHRVHCHSAGGEHHWLACSECQHLIGRADKYCPNCGAKMDGEESE